MYEPMNDLRMNSSYDSDDKNFEENAPRFPPPKKLTSHYDIRQVANDSNNLFNRCIVEDHNGNAILERFPRFGLFSVEETLHDPFTHEKVASFVSSSFQKDIEMHYHPPTSFLGSLPHSSSSSYSSESYSSLLSPQTKALNTKKKQNQSFRHREEDEIAVTLRRSSIWRLPSYFEYEGKKFRFSIKQYHIQVYILDHTEKTLKNVAKLKVLSWKERKVANLEMHDWIFEQTDKPEALRIFLILSIFCIIDLR
eukprot:TRINITY_DN4815_c0_g1_i1.p1 TRINITY_DN4815_c0_g1~~TRINITY_DN4815_c0_g1_i1.p1  ORF type:complete len:252 (+),score=65.70 TRINITY_DN4815_c0_g1_i1:63-818(+)